MHDPASTPRNVLLVADPRSQAAVRVARELAAHGYRVERAAPGQPVSGPQVAGVFLLEAAVTPKLLRGLLGCVRAPTLVLAATRELVANVMPLLRSDDDVGSLDEVSGLAAWRLQRLIDRAQGSGPRPLRLDPLTGLMNRNAFEHQLQESIATLRPGDAVGLLMLDLDHFKSLNDRHGHVVGDKALQRLADMLRRRLPREDIAARIGGDEFVVLMRRPDCAAVIGEARQLIEAVAALELGGPTDATGTPPITASGGLAFLAPESRPLDVLNAADVATYEAKTEGRDRLVRHDEMVERAERGEHDLRLVHFENSTRVATERLVGMIATKSRRLIEEARKEANHCALTGLYNRRYLDTQLSRDIERARTWCRPLAVALVDIDNFGQFNKLHGAPTADRVLRAFGTVAKDGLRASDWVARYGGDEFLFVMPGTTVDAARQVIERVSHAFASQRIESLDGRTLSATLSAGIVELSLEPQAADQLVGQASLALNRAKAGGRNRIESATG